MKHTNRKINEYESMLLTHGYYVRTGDKVICFINTEEEQPQKEISGFANTTLKDAISNYMPVSKEIVKRFIEENKRVTSVAMQQIKQEKLTYFIFGYKSLVATNAYND